MKTLKKESKPVSENILNAFEAMWGAYPSAVMLLKRNREIVAVNDAASELGIPVGTKCFSLTGSTTLCEGCQGNGCLKSSSARRSTKWNEKLNIFADTYWFPVKGETDLFVHFGNDITEWVKDELIKK